MVENIFEKDQWVKWRRRDQEKALKEGPAGMSGVEFSESCQPGSGARDAMRERLYMKAMLYFYRTEICEGQNINTSGVRLRIQKYKQMVKERRI